MSWGQVQGYIIAMAKLQIFLSTSDKNAILLNIYCNKHLHSVVYIAHTQYALAEVFPCEMKIDI